MATHRQDRGERGFELEYGAFRLPQYCGASIDGHSRLGYESLSTSSGALASQRGSEAAYRLARPAMQ